MKETQYRIQFNSKMGFESQPTIKMMGTSPRDIADRVELLGDTYTFQVFGMKGFTQEYSYGIARNLLGSSRIPTNTTK